jgi:hypothetical protein
MNPGNAEFARIVQQQFPAPIARAHAKIATYASPLHRIYAVRDLTEVTLKYCSVIVLQEYLQSGMEVAVTNQAIVRTFRRPTLGLWNEVLRETARALLPRRGTVVVPELIDQCFDASGRPRRSFHDLIDQLIAFRNFDAHSALADDDELERRVRHHLPFVEQLLASLVCLIDCPLVYVESPGVGHLHMGIAESTSQPQALPLEPGRLYVVRNGRAVTLFPWLLHGPCGAGTVHGPCTLRKTFFFNGGPRRRPDYLEYIMAHHKQAADVAALLEEYAERARADAEAADARTRLLPWYVLVEKARTFVGRVEEERQILRFLLDQPSGYVSAIGDPGIGKSALIAQIVLDLVDQGEADDWSEEVRTCISELWRRRVIVVCHVCTAKRRETIDLATILLSLRLQLEHYATLGTDRPPQNSALDLIQLAALVALRQNAKVLLVIDGVDEAISQSQPHAQVVEGLPLEGPLPPGVYVLASARRGVLPERPDLSTPALRVALKGLSRGEMRYLLGQAGDKYELREHHLDAIERVSAGSPLYVKLFAEDLREGRLTLEDIRRLPEGVEGLFESLIERLCGDYRWPTIRDCLLTLALARDHLTVKQLQAITGRPWAAVQSALDDALASMVVEDESETAYGYQLFHEQFREFVLNLFSEKRPAVASRLSRRFVRIADPEMQAEGELTAARHLESARTALIDYCRRWADVSDAYPVRHLPALLFEMGALDELSELLQRSPFLSIKLTRLGDPYLLAADIRYLTLSLLAASRDDEIVELSVTEEAYQRDGVAAGLRDADHDLSTRVSTIIRALLAREHERPGALWSAWGRLTHLRRRRMALSLVNARRVALEVAYHRGDRPTLLAAADDRWPVVRALLVPYLYRFWRKRRGPGWELLHRLSLRLSRLGLPKVRMLQVCGGMSLTILIYHFNEPEVTARLRQEWQASLWHYLRTPLIGVLKRRSVVSVGTSALRLIMAGQPDFQPLNLREIRKSYSRSAASAAAHRDGLEALICLEHPESGFAPAIKPPMARDRPFDVYLMLLIERALVFHGCRNPGPVLAALETVHGEGCRWFQQSVLYAAFHILYSADRVDTSWLDVYARLTRETIQSRGATFRTDIGEYSLAPHMAWVEVVFEKHRPMGRARFIPAFAKAAVANGDAGYVGRVIRSCELLSLAYRHHGIALDALRPLLGLPDQKLREAVVNVLASIRFHDEEAVDRFLDQEKAHELGLRLASAAPRVEAGDIFTWIDGFVNHSMVHSDTFRLELVGAFRRAGEAENPTEMMQRVTGWVVNLVAGRAVVDQ